MVAFSSVLKRTVFLLVVVMTLLAAVNSRQPTALASVQTLPECWTPDKVSITGASTLATSAVQRTSTYEIHDDDSVNPNHTLTGLPHYDTLTWEGSADVQWLVLEGNFSRYEIDSAQHKVTFFDIEDTLHIVYRTQNFVRRSPDQIRFCVNGVNNQAWATQVNVHYPANYQIQSVLPPGYTNPAAGRLSWNLGVVNTFQVDTTFAGLGPERPQLDLPVDYAGRAAGSSVNFAAAFSTRITSKFDHRSPNYNKDQKFLPANGVELDDKENVQCTYGYNCYDGHNAYDIDDRCPTSSPCDDARAVYAAAGGTIVADRTGWDNASGCYITIDHGNQWRTFYGHLRDSKRDHTCDGILIRSGPVNRTDKIGIIGGTGSGGGGDSNTHLHFGVYHDGKVVDPSGWEPNPAVYADPWAEHVSGAESFPMWLYSTRTTQSLAPSTGGQIQSPTHEIIVDVPAGYYNVPLVFNLSYESVAGENGPLVPTGHAFSLTASDSLGAFVHELNEPVAMRVNFDAADVEDVRSDELAFYRYDEVAERWVQLPTEVNWNEGFAVAMTDHLSIFALSGPRKVAPVFLPVALVIPYVPPTLPLLNGNFEAGAANWTQSSSHNWPVIVNSDQVDGLPTHSGIWIAWLGGDDDETSTIEQTVTVPPDRPFLTYYHGIASEDACGYDYGRVLVDGAVVEQYTLCRNSNTPDWAYRVVNLSAYAGRTVALQFRATTDGSLNSNLLIDDVAFNSATAVRAAPVPFRWPDGVSR